MQGRSGQEYPFYKVRDISIAWTSGSRFLLGTDNSLSGAEAASIRAKPLPSGTLVFAKIGEALRLNRRAITTVPSLIDNNTMGMWADPELVEPQYLYWYSTITKFDSDARASVVPSIRKSDVANLHFPLPPRAEQIRIVEKLEELLSDLDAGVAELKAAQRKLTQYRLSLLQDAVETSGSGSSYARRPLGELVVSIGQGWSPKCEDGAVDSGWAVIKTTAIQPLSFDGSHNKKLPGNLKPREHLELKSGDLLVTRAGPRSRVGITCLVRQARSRLILCDKAYRVRCDESRINPAFLELVLNAPGFVNEIDRLKTGINDSGLNLTQDRFFTLSIPLPSLAEQAQIIEALALQNHAIADQERAVAKGLEQADAQRKNLLKAAFAGHLVPQNPSDEAASELLARIRAARVADSATHARKRGRKTKETA